MSRFVLATIVEGDGDRAALPKLINGALRKPWVLPQPIKVARNRVVKRDDAFRLEHYLPLAASRIRERGGRGGVLVLLDADDDAPCRLGPDLLERAKLVVPETPVAVVLATRMFESWLVAGGAVDSQEPPDEIHNPKRLIRDVRGGYRETIDQPELAGRIDTGAAQRRSPSFDKLLRDLDRLEREGGGGSAEVSG